MCGCIVLCSCFVFVLFLFAFQLLVMFYSYHIDVRLSHLNKDYLLTYSVYQFSQHIQHSTSSQCLFRDCKVPEKQLVRFGHFHRSSYVTL